MAANEVPGFVTTMEEKATIGTESNKAQGLSLEIDEPMLPTWRLAIICIW